MLGSKNRVLNMIESQRVAIAGRLDQGLVTQAQVDTCAAEMDMDLEEFCRFQELKSAASGSLLTLDEAQAVYGYLGETPEHFNGQRVEVKVVLTKLFHELLARRIGSIRRQKAGAA